MTAALYNAMLSHGVSKTLQDWGWSITPFAVLRNATLAECAKTVGKMLTVLSDQAAFPARSKVVHLREVTISSAGEGKPEHKIDFALTEGGEVYIDSHHLEKLSKDYAKMHMECQEILKKFGINVERYLAGEIAVKEVRPSRTRS